MNQVQAISPKEWITDVDEKSLSEAQAFYLKNREYFLNIHGGKINGHSIGKSTPIPANYKLCDISFPAGENYAIKTYSDKRTNEIYVFVYNSFGVHFIYRIDVNGCDIVYDGDCILFDANPDREITQFRCWLDIKTTCKNWGGKRLIFTDGVNIYNVDVEASIATNSFTTPYFENCIIPKTLTSVVLPTGVTVTFILPAVGSTVKVEVKDAAGVVVVAASHTVNSADTLNTIINSLLIQLQSRSYIFSPYSYTDTIHFFTTAGHTYYQSTITDAGISSCCSDPCDFVKLCVTPPLDCLKEISYIPRTPADKLPNKMVDVGFQYKFQWVYYDERKSTWSDASSYYFQSNSKECFETPEDVARCMKIRIPLGNAMVVRINLAYSNDNGASWQLAESIEKYKQYNSAQEMWYQRQYAEIITSPGANYSTVDCSFDYVFCNDKQCGILSPADVNKVYNPFPRGAQGLIPYKESIAFYNYLKGNCPLPKSVSDKFNVELDCPLIATNCQAENVTIKVRAVIHDFWHDRNQVIFTQGADTEKDVARFGGLQKRGAGDLEIGWGQEFNGKTRNFIAYIEGTSYSCEMKQWKKEGNTRTEVGIIGNFDKASARGVVRDVRGNGGYYYQEAIFTVPKGTRGFIRIASHHATTADDTTSTHVVGMISAASYNGQKDLGGVDTTNINKDEEIEFDGCGGNQDIWDRILVIRDNAIDGGFSKKSCAVNGYVKDDNGHPLEGIWVYLDYLTLPSRSRTDHNGFYHIVVADGFDGTRQIKAFGETACSPSGFTEIGVGSASMVSGSMAEYNFLIKNVSYLNNYAKVIVNVKDCAGQPIEGVRVAMRGSKSQISHLNGEAVFKLRNYQGGGRFALAIAMDKNGCIESGCNNNCNPCMPREGANMPACYVPSGSPISVTLNPLVLNITSIHKTQSHLKYGGRYGFGLIVKGDCGQLSFVNKGLYVNIPKMCNGANTGCELKFDFTGITFPSWVKSVQIVRTKNLNPFELQWVVDKAEYIDGEAKIKLTIQSLNDYNFNAAFKSNTIYQYLKNDRLEFIADELGSFYCDSLNYQILSPFHDQVVSGKKDAPADFFNQLIIKDDGRIKKILPGTIIELQRPQECIEEDIYYTICANLPIVNGQASVLTGTFTTFDSYTVNRKIGSSPIRQFEHHSPSDFWGDHLSDIGTAHIVNAYEDEKRMERNITIADSDDLSSFGSLEKTIGDSQMGGIVAMSISDDKIILAICENDNFIAQTADDLLRIGAGGVVQASSGDQAISNPQAKIAGKYGCQYEHIGGIYFGDGYATWADVNSHAFIVHDYQMAKEASFNKIGTWTAKRFQEMQTWNNAPLRDPLDKYRFSTGFNHLNGIVMLTLKRLRDSGIDNAHEPFISPNETIFYKPTDGTPAGDKFYGQGSCTPEAYGSINLFNDKGSAYVVINHGQPWVCPIIPDRWGEYFGVPVDQVVGVCMNKFPGKEKIAMAIEIIGDRRWFAKKVTTDRVNFLSEIPPIRWRKQPNKSNAAFLCDINSPGGLYGNQKNYAGTNTIGYFVKVIFIRDNTFQLEYGSIDNTKRILYDELDAILFKFITKEPSGFENV